MIPIPSVTGAHPFGAGTTDPDPDAPATIAEAADALAGGRVTAEALVERALARIADPAGEGARAFLEVQAGPARLAARAMDLLRRAGRAPSPWAGIPISVKDLYDQEGRVSRAASRALADAPPAAATAPAVRRLERAGFVVLGRTNMVEFAFSGLGHNPHHGTPLSPWDRATGRLPGGSSSGAGVAAADGMGFAALGSDTGGSCRIPAALCGVVGWKPTARRVPLEGTVPLSHTLDSLGPIARSVACCAVIDSAMAGEDRPAPEAIPLTHARFALPRRSFLFDDLAPAVAHAFEAALRRLAGAGATIEEIDLPELAEIPAANARGGFAAAEAWSWHAPLIARARDLYDPNVLARIERGSTMTAAEYQQVTAERARIGAAIDGRTGEYDAFLAPTCPLLPPALREIERPEDYARINQLLLRNPAVGNFLDRCSISLPCHAPGEAPVGLMLTGATLADRHLLALARAVEAALRPADR